MNEQTLNIASIVIELSAPAVLGAGVWRSPNKKRLLLTPLLAIAPLLLLFAWISTSYMLSRGSESDAFAFHTMWIMCFVPYIVLLLGGIAAGFFWQYRFEQAHQPGA